MLDDFCIHHFHLSFSNLIELENGGNGLCLIYMDNIVLWIMLFLSSHLISSVGLVQSSVQGNNH